ncbi:MAG: glycosyltransferase [Betaproteobacteria bacterium]|nr:glycosyltransferase [Betaproteobacteria bacterium]
MKILFPYMARWHAVNWSRYHSLLYALADLGHDVYVLQPPPLKSAETNFQEITTSGHPRIRVLDVRLSAWLWELRMPLDKLFKKAYFSIAAYGTARELIVDERIDVLLLYNIPQYRFSGIPSVKVVFDYADDYIDMLSFELGRIDNPLARWLASRMLQTMMDRSACTLTVSNVLARQARGNVHVLPNGVSLEKASRPPPAPIAQVTKRGKPVVGFLGAFEYFIDVDLLVDVAKAMPDAHFLFVGTGRRWRHVADRAATEHIDNLQLVGGVPHDQVFAYIREMDVCLNTFTKLPVSHRACPIKLFEYLSQRKPVVSTRLDELAHIDSGFLWYGDTVDETVDSIRAILAGGPQVNERVELGYQLTESRYTWDRIARTFAGLVEPLLGRGR